MLGLLARAALNNLGDRAEATLAQHCLRTGGVLVVYWWCTDDTSRTGGGLAC